MTLWMYLVDPKDHILKVQCHYLYFWMSYSGSLIKLLTCQRREKRERERTVILVVALPAGVRQGLPNYTCISNNGTDTQIESFL